MFPMALRYLEHAPPNLPVLLGGVFATFAPDLAMSFPRIDMLCVGEGERALVELCNAMNSGKDRTKIPGIWVKDHDGRVIRNAPGDPINPDDNPLPDLSIFEDTRHLQPRGGKVWRLFQVETHRGCPYKCTFCNSPDQDRLYEEATGKQFFRKKSMSRIREELLHVIKNWGANYIGFWADTFLAWTTHEFDAFCEMYQDIKLPFWCQTRLETLTRENVRRLKEAGVHRMDLGLEHGNEKFRREVVDRRYPNSIAIEKIALLGEFKIPHTLNNIIGLPTETRELAWDTIELCRQMPLDTARASIFMPYHGTRLHALAVQKGYIPADLICPINPNEPVLDMPGFTKDQIKGFLRTFNMYVRFEKNRWSEIMQAEKMTSTGDSIFERLQQEFKDRFYSAPADMTDDNLSNPNGPATVLAGGLN